MSWTHSQKNDITEDIIVGLFQTGLPIDQIASSPILTALSRIGISVSTSEVESIIENYSDESFREILDLIRSNNQRIALSYHSFSENGKIFMSLNAHCRLGDQVVEFVLDFCHIDSLSSVTLTEFVTDTIERLSLEDSVAFINSDFSEAPQDTYEMSLGISKICKNIHYSLKRRTDWPEFIKDIIFWPYYDMDPTNYEKFFFDNHQSVLDQNFETLLHSKDTVPYFGQILDKLGKVSYILQEGGILYSVLKRYAEKNNVSKDVITRLRSYSRFNFRSYLPALESLLKIHRFMTLRDWEIFRVEFKTEEIEFCECVCEFFEILDLYANLENESGLTTACIIPLSIALKYRFNKLLKKAIEKKDKDLALSLKIAECDLFPDYDHIDDNPPLILSSMLIDPSKVLGLDDTLTYLTKKQEETVVFYIATFTGSYCYGSYPNLDIEKIDREYDSYREEQINDGLEYISYEEYFNLKANIPIEELPSALATVTAEIYEFTKFKKAFFQRKRSLNEVVDFYIKNETLMEEKFPILMRFIPTLLIIPSTKSSNDRALSSYKKLESDQMRYGSSNRKGIELSQLLKAKSIMKAMSALRKS